MLNWQQIHKTENRLTQLGGSGPGSFSSVKTRNTNKITGYVEGYISCSSFLWVNSQLGATRIVDLFWHMENKNE